jgi:hypothetical protein
MKTYFYPLLLSLVFWSCSDSSSDNNSNSENNTIKQPATLTIAESVIEQQPDKKRSKYDDMKKIVARAKLFTKKFGESYDKVMYSSFIDGKLFFYVLRGTWEDENWGENGTIKKGTYKIGLVTEQNEVVIPLEYDKIYNMGGTAANLIEVEVNGKLGAYDIDGHEILAVEYDAIYPYKEAGDVWVQLRKGSTFGWLSRQGGINMQKGSHKDESLFQTPIASNLINSWNFDSESNTVHPIFETDEEFYEENGIGILFTPSYLYQLGIAREFQRNWIFKISTFGFKSIVASVDKQEKLDGGITALFTTFDEAFADARGYHDKSQDVVTVNEKMEKMDILPIPVSNDSKFCSSQIKFKLISNKLLEVLTPGGNKYTAYEEMPNYRYYEISKTGQFTPLEIQGNFKFTRATKITEDYFKGCYSRYITSAEAASVKEDNYFNYVSFGHLSIEDLDVMRNEIFASHGYTFKSKKWQKLFKKEAWYKAEFDNVDTKLTEIEKHNIKVILDMKKKMEGNEAKYTNKSFEQYVPAG